MSRIKRNYDRGNKPDAASRTARYTYWGAALGSVIGLAMLYVVVFFHGKDIGLATAECALLSCTMTILLSQPVVGLGLVAGAISGGVCGVIGQRLGSRSRQTEGATLAVRAGHDWSVTEPRHWWNRAYR